MTKQTYQRGVDILLDAYRNKTLISGNCQTCAVGNLLGNGAWGFFDFYTLLGNQIRYDDEAKKEWFRRSEYSHLGVCNPFSIKELDKIDSALADKLKSLGSVEFNSELYDEIINTLNNFYQEKGFTKEELMKIEYTFERTISTLPDTTPHQERYYSGLSAILDLMVTMIEDDIDVNQAYENQTKLQLIATTVHGIY